MSPILFIGDSITEQWAWFRPSLFESGAFLNRGIGGQTTRDIRARFLGEVRETGARSVHLLAGINDIAENGGPIAVAETQDNLAWMIERAAGSGCRVLVGSLTPAEVIVWNPRVEPLAKIAAVNSWLRDFAATHNAIYVDYHAALRSRTGGLRRGLGPDGLHLNQKGYRRMEPVLRAALEAGGEAEAAGRRTWAERVVRFVRGFPPRPRS